ncbi:MAG: hypothetical protein J6K21_00600 [Bacilli bacterium]|nr:hypothetical protein [Bacilli bacterium]
MKKIIFISISILLIIGLATGCGCNKKEKVSKDNPNYDANFNVAKDQEVDGLKISGVSLIINKNGVSSFSATVTNTTSEIYKLNTIKLIFKDKNKNNIEEFIGFIGSDITPDESRSLTFSTDKDLTKAYEIEYQIIK